MRLSIIVPTYNERDNISPLIERIGQALGKGEYDYEVLVVDDNSPDGTAGVAESLSGDYPVKVIVREGKMGLASAVVEGMRRAEGEVFGVIDADLQHPPELVVQLAQATAEGYDVAVASRYVRGGGIEDWSLLRRIVSKAAILMARPLVRARDPVSGCFFLKKEVVADIDFKPSGFKILLEILVKGKYDRLKEVPYVFGERARGKSKLGRGEFASYLRLLCGLYLFKLKRAFAVGRPR